MNAPTEIPEIDAAEALAQVDAGTVLLLDVREDDEWAAGHAPQAEHRPLGSLGLDDVPEGRPVVVVCRSGKRSATATRALLAAGRDARNLTGGMQDWAARGLPVVATDGGPGDVI